MSVGKYKTWNEKHTIVILKMNIFMFIFLIAPCTQETEKFYSWMYWLENNQVLELVKFMLLSIYVTNTNTQFVKAFSLAIYAY